MVPLLVVSRLMSLRPLMLPEGQQCALLELSQQSLFGGGIVRLVLLRLKCWNDQRLNRRGGEGVHRGGHAEKEPHRGTQDT